LPFEQERLDLRSFCCFALVVLWILACLGDFFLLSINFLMLSCFELFVHLSAVVSFENYLFCCSGLFCQRDTIFKESFAAAVPVRVPRARNC